LDDWDITVGEFDWRESALAHDRHGKEENILITNLMFTKLTVSKLWIIILVCKISNLFLDYINGNSNVQ
jgi:hypothetical protein